MMEPAMFYSGHFLRTPIFCFFRFRPFSGGCWLLVVGVVGWLAWAGLGFRLGFGLGSGVVLGGVGWCWVVLGGVPTLAKNRLWPKRV